MRSDHIAPAELPNVNPRILTFHPDNEVLEKPACRVEEAGEHYDFHIDRL